MKKFSIAINRTYAGKMPNNASKEDWANYNDNFESENVTIDGLASAIKKGFGFTTWHKGRRKADHFLQGQHLGLDFDTEDDNSRIDTLLQDEFIRQNAAIVYTTHSHTSESPRARVIFLLDEPINDPIEYTDTAKALLARYGSADPVCKDACRLFYGSVDCDLRVIGNVMSLEYVQNEVLAPYRREVARQKQVQKENAEKMRKQYGNVEADNDVKAHYVEAIIADEVAKVMCALPGSQHSARLNAAIKLGSLLKSDWIPAGVIDEQRIYDEIIAAWLSSGGDDKSGRWNVEATIRDGIGYAEPRPEPIWKKSGRNVESISVNHETGEIIEKEKELPDFNLFDYKAEDGGILDFWRDHYAEDWVYATGWETWMKWEGRYWGKDNVNAINLEVQDTINMLNDYAEEKRKEISQKRIDVENDIDNPNQKTELKKLESVDKKIKSYVAATKRTNGRVSGVIEMAKAHCSAPSEGFDGGNYLNLCNGTINLDTLKFRPHDKGDHQTYVLDYPYVPHAKAERWEKFLRETIIKSEDDKTPDLDTIAHVQEIVGYSLTTHTKEEKMVWLAGEGGNGKSVFIKTIRRLLGSLARSIDFQTLGKPGNYDLATLPGVRIVVSTESNKNEGISESIIKNIVSGDTMNVRPIYGKPFDLTPVCKVWWAMNSLPVIRGTDDSIWRRLSLVNFHRHFSDAEKDTSLTETLSAELPGILNWALVGLRRYYENKHFTESACVKSAVEEYRRESNPVLLYVEERTVAIEGKDAPSSQIYMDYQNWCRDSGRVPMNQTNFGKELSRLKIPKTRDSSSNRYGIVLKSMAHHV